MRAAGKTFQLTFRYYLNLVLVDEEERRYFKQQEITLWRKGERVRKLPLANRSNSCGFPSSYKSQFAASTNSSMPWQDTKQGTSLPRGWEILN